MLSSAQPKIMICNASRNPSVSLDFWLYYSSEDHPSFSGKFSARMSPCFAGSRFPTMGFIHLLNTIAIQIDERTSVPEASVMISSATSFCYFHVMETSCAYRGIFMFRAGGNLDQLYLCQRSECGCSIGSCGVRILYPQPSMNCILE